MQDHDWLFDVVLDLCEKAEELGLPAMSAKLEDALDAYLDDQGRASNRLSEPEGQFVPVGPISLGPDTAIFGSRGPAEPQLPTLQPFASHRRAQSPAIEQPLTGLARSEAEKIKEDVLVLMNKAG